MTIHHFTGQQEEVGVCSVKQISHATETAMTFAKCYGSFSASFQ